MATTSLRSDNTPSTSPPPQQQAPPYPPRKRLHTEDEPLPAPTNAPSPKRLKKTKAKNIRLHGGMTIIRGERPTSSLSRPASPPLPALTSFSTRPSARAPSPSTSFTKPAPLKRTLPVSGPAGSTHQSKASSSKPPSASGPPKDNASQQKTASSSHEPLRESTRAPVASSSKSKSALAHDVFGSVQPTSIRSKDITLPLPIRDTPLIEKNREMRMEASHRRRSSLDYRRRASESIGKSGGIMDEIVVPHPNVPSTLYHRHISTDVPPAQRARQLLVWSSSRAHIGSSTAGTSSLPALSPESASLLKTVQDAVIRMLADGTIDTSMWASTKGKEKETRPQVLLPNPRNVKNLERITRWEANIARAQAEQGIWSEITRSANAHLEQLRTAAESKAGENGKKRPEEWIQHLDERWQESARIALAAAEKSGPDKTDSEIQTLLQDVEHDVDELSVMINTMSELTIRADGVLNKFFKTVSTHLDSRGTGMSIPSSMNVLSTVRIPARASGRAVDDHGTNWSTWNDNPLATLRALSRVEPVAGRPPSRAAVRAAQEVGVERRVTAVPPTPGKTPRRGSTPGRKR